MIRLFLVISESRTGCWGRKKSWNILHLHFRWIFTFMFSYSKKQDVAQEGSVLFNDTLNTFSYSYMASDIMVKDHSDSERGNPLPPHGLLFPISSKGSFICTIPQTG